MQFMPHAVLFYFYLQKKISFSGSFVLNISNPSLLLLIGSTEHRGFGFVQL